MTMTGRFVDNGIRILAAAALLAVMFSPIRPTKASHTAPSPNSLSRNFAIFKFEHSSHFAISAHPSFREADSLQSDREDEDELDADIEDELTLTSPPASVSFNVLPSPCPEPRFELVSFAVALTARPLRC
ncbi:hypothetical protein [Paludisphaera borealis]|uniref:Uncharacterized protein n=1 Tax=Paludisphaera borealis TaxID=1387353 RepID=A0A1U7CKL0_9BACT|nr:hypothetical protein [Paludisphaera borealis]APW59475.1 hypothetical protein BSF38_00899 [Paludisphaera borealis]